jgi:cell division transport system permease protein
MAFMAGLALLFSRATLRLSGDWQSQLSRSLTVQVTLAPLSEENGFDNQMNFAEQTIRSVLDSNISVSVMKKRESEALIKPWIGNLDLPDSLTLPGLVSVETRDGTTLPSASTLERQLQDLGIVASVDDHSRWENQIQETARNLVLSGGGLLALLLFAAICVSLFATQASMAAQRSIITVLAQVGATDGYIAGLFIRQAAQRSAIGAGIGLLGLVFIWTLLSFSLISEDIFWSGLIDSLADLFWLGGLWFLYVLFFALAAGFATKRALIDDRRRA